MKAQDGVAKELRRKSTSRDRAWGLAVLYVLAMLGGDILARLGWGPKLSLQDVVVGSTFFVLWGIGGLLLGIHDLCERVGPPRQ